MSKVYKDHADYTARTGITANVTGAAEVQAFLCAVPFGADAVRKALTATKEASK